MTLQISHPSLDPTKLTKRLDVTPIIAQDPGESKIRHGDCPSAGYYVASSELGEHADHS